MNPSPTLLIISNTFPTLLLHFTFYVIIKSESTKILLHLANTIQTTKTSSNIIYTILALLFTIIAYLFLFCIGYFYIFYLHLVLDNHLVRLRAQNNLLCFVGFIKKDKETTTFGSFPREFDIKPSSHPRGENKSFPLLYTLHLESQPNPYSFWHRWLEATPHQVPLSTRAIPSSYVLTRGKLSTLHFILYESWYHVLLVMDA